MKKNWSILAVLVIIFSVASCSEERDELMESKTYATEKAALSNQNAIDTIRVKSLNAPNSLDGDGGGQPEGDTPPDGDPPPKNGQQWFN